MSFSFGKEDEINNYFSSVIHGLLAGYIHRTIHMTENDPEPSDLGYSTGRWDADTLIVDTTRVDWPD